MQCSKIFDIEDINLRECALLIVDELGDVEASPLTNVLLEPTQNTARLADAAREVGVPVIFANDAHISGLDRELELWGEHSLVGTPEAKPSAQLNLSEKDYVIEKRRYSAFYQTGLRLLLKELGVNTLILCGFDTNICIAHTAADAFFENMNIIVVSDATATFLIGEQEEGLAYMNKVYAAAIAATEEVLVLIQNA